MVTADAKTRNGLFKVHRINNRLLFEIPRKELNRDQLLVTEIAKTTLGVGYGGQALGNRVLRWEKRDNRVLLRSMSYEVIASDTTSPVVGAVQAANVEPILAVFNVEAYGPDSSVGHRRVAAVHAGAARVLAGAAHLSARAARREPQLH